MSSRLERRLLAVLLASVLIPALLTGMILVAFARLGAYRDDLSPAVVILLTGLVLTLVAVGVAAQTLGRSVVRAVREIQLGTELMATVNPGHRLAVRTGDELGALAAEINRLADHLREARVGLEGEVARATHELAVERGKLSSVLEALGEGVVLATPEGRISLANRAARELLGASLLGRSLFDFVDREKVAHFRDRLRAGGGHGAGPAERFTLHPAGKRVLQTVMTPFLDVGTDGVEPPIIGYILVLRDVTATARSDEERRRLLADTVQELRNPLASIRSLSESLLGDPALAAGPGGRGEHAPKGALALPLLEAIHAEAVRLSERVKGLEEPTERGLAGPLRHVEVVGVAELGMMALRRLTDAELGEVQVGAFDSDSRTQIRAEVTALSEALAHLLRAALARRAVGGPVWLRPALRGRLLQIEAGAGGGAAVAELEALLDQPLAVGSTVREVARQHAGEVWAYADAGGFAYRLTIPTVQPEDAAAVDARDAAPRVGLVGVGTRSGWGGGEDGSASRPYYDFSLLEELEGRLRPADRDRALGELTYVVFDTETTGLHPEAGDRVVSIAGVKVRGGVVRRGETFDALVNPGRPIPAASVSFHGITDEMVADAPSMDVVLPAFFRFVEDAVLVADQAWFDLRCLVHEARRAGLPPLGLTHPPLDTVHLSEVVHGPRAQHWLDATAARLGVAVHGRHSALGDALAIAEIFVRLVGLLEKRGIRTLGEAVDAVRAQRGLR